MTAYLLSLAEVARRLSLSDKRIYQLDDELHPKKVRRGTRGKMITRWYDPTVVEAYRLKHQKGSASVVARDIDRAARDVAARHLNQLADTAPFFLGAPPTETDRVRERIRTIAKKLAKEA